MIKLKITGIDKTFNYLEDAFDEQNEYAFDIFKFYAAEIVKYFINVQTISPAEIKGQFWTNHTFKAAKSFFTNAYKVRDKSIILRMEYDTNLAPYVKYLEFYNDERFAALPRLLRKFYPMILKDLKVLYGDT